MNWIWFDRIGNVLLVTFLVALVVITWTEHWRGERQIRSRCDDAYHRIQLFLAAVRAAVRYR